MTERQPYDVVEQHDGFELRRYPDHMVAEVTVTATFEEAGSRAFRALAGYISGQNRHRSRVEMTAPVAQEPGSETIAMTAPVVQAEGEEGEYVIAFVLPEAMTLSTAPVPTNPEVRIRAVPDQLAAARRFSGRGSEQSFAGHLHELRTALAAAGLRASGPPTFARFDPPYTPWFRRHNEVVLPIEA